MSYNLEKELIAVRNLSEGLMDIILRICREEHYVGFSEDLEKCRDAYQIHREENDRLKESLLTKE